MCNPKLIPKINNNADKKMLSYFALTTHRNINDLHSVVSGSRQKVKKII